MKIAKRFATAVFTATLAMTVAACGSAPTTKTVGEVIDDATLTAKVKGAIFNEPTLKVSEIQVETFKGDVQLSGFVAQPEDAAKAAEVAGGVSGAKTVENDIRIK